MDRIPCRRIPDSFLVHREGDLLQRLSRGKLFPPFLFCLRSQLIRNCMHSAIIPWAPIDIIKAWGVYIVVKKTNDIPLIYIGSGTSVRGGVSTRLREYNLGRDKALSNYVNAAIQNGYEIIHKGLLVWCPIPSPANIPIFRLLFIAMETAFNFLFWSMKSEGKDYGRGNCCPWPRDSFSYNGFYGYSFLVQLVAGNFDLSNEQLEAMAAVVEEKK